MAKAKRYPTTPLLPMLLMLGCGDARPPLPSGVADAGLPADMGASAVDAAETPDVGPAPDASAEPDAGLVPDAGVATEAPELLYQYLSGRFDSAEQAANDQRYFSIQLWICPVDAPELGPRVLYVEQARSDSLAQPYRQRLYVIEPLADEHQTRAVSRVFELADPAAAVGLCERPASGVFAASDATEKVGCGVFMTWDTDHFSGQTHERDCPSSLNGASFASSEVELRSDQMSSWDRGYDADGAQVWGATAGPYRFVRRTPLPDR